MVTFRRTWPHVYGRGKKRFFLIRGVISVLLFDGGGGARFQVDHITDVNRYLQNVTSEKKTFQLLRFGNRRVHPHTLINDEFFFRHFVLVLP